MPGGEVNNPIRTITTTIINSNIDIRKINWETFILLIEKCNLCAVYLPFFDCRGMKQDEREPVLQSESKSIFLPCNIMTESDHAAVSGKSDNGWNRARKNETERREKECRAGKTDGLTWCRDMKSSNKAAVSSNTDTGLGVGKCARVCVRMLWHAPFQTTGVWWGNSISSATQTAWRSSISQFAAIDPSCHWPGWGQPAGQHGSVNPSGAWMTWTQRQKSSGIWKHNHKSFVYVWMCIVWGEGLSGQGLTCPTFSRLSCSNDYRPPPHAPIQSCCELWSIMLTGLREKTGLLLR